MSLKTPINDCLKSKFISINVYPIDNTHKKCICILCGKEWIEEKNIDLNGAFTKDIFDKKEKQYEFKNTN